MQENELPIRSKPLPPNQAVVNTIPIRTRPLPQLDSHNTAAALDSEVSINSEANDDSEDDCRPPAPRKTLKTLDALRYQAHAINTSTMANIPAPHSADLFGKLPPELRTRIFEFVADDDLLVFFQDRPAVLVQQRPEGQLDTHITSNAGIRQVSKLWRSEYLSILAGDVARWPALCNVQANIVDFGFMPIASFLNYLDVGDVNWRSQPPFRYTTLKISFTKTFVHAFDSTALDQWFWFHACEKQAGKEHGVTYAMCNNTAEPLDRFEDYEKLLKEIAWWYSPNWPDFIMEMVYFRDFVLDYAVGEMEKLNPGSTARMTRLPRDVPMLTEKTVEMRFG